MMNRRDLRISQPSICKLHVWNRQVAKVGVEKLGLVMMEWLPRRTMGLSGHIRLHIDSTGA